MKWIIAFLACIGIAQAQIQQHQISDDGYVRIPLQFPFPYYGRVFTESYMFSNGVIGFLNPTNSWCCSGFDLNNARGTPFSFAIMPLQTDLLNYQGRFLTEGTPQYQRYVWENISEFGAPQNLNTFGVEIRPSGYIGMHYEQINISPFRPITIGRTGDTDRGEFQQYYHGAGYYTNQAFSHITETTGDMCLINPLFSPSCVGYQEAYLAQQCSINALYSPQCPNYAQAYLTQQCSLNALYDKSCDGYAEAYALANVITPRVTTTAPVLQVSTTGTISVETPIVADVVVNEVITRQPTQAVVTRSTSQPTSQVEKKEEKKEEAPKKEVKVVKAPEVKNELNVSTPQIVEIKRIEAPSIVDLSYGKLFANLKTIRENPRLSRMWNDSDKRHREMLDEQWRR